MQLRQSLQQGCGGGEGHSAGAEVAIRLQKELCGGAGSLLHCLLCCACQAATHPGSWRVAVALDWAAVRESSADGVMYGCAYIRGVQQELNGQRQPVNWGSSTMLAQVWMPGADRAGAEVIAAASRLIATTYEDNADFAKIRVGAAGAAGAAAAGSVHAAPPHMVRSQSCIKVSECCRS